MKGKNVGRMTDKCFIWLYVSAKKMSCFITTSLFNSPSTFISITDSFSKLLSTFISITDFFSDPQIPLSALPTPFPIIPKRANAIFPAHLSAFSAFMILASRLTTASVSMAESSLFLSLNSISSPSSLSQIWLLYSS